MVLTAGLFKRFKCFWTSSFCLDTLNLAALDTETRPQKQKAKANNILILLKCTPQLLPQPQVTIFTKNPQQKPKLREQTLPYPTHTLWCRLKQLKHSKHTLLPPLQLTCAHTQRKRKLENEKSLKTGTFYVNPLLASPLLILRTPLWVSPHFLGLSWANCEVGLLCMCCVSVQKIQSNSAHFCLSFTHSLSIRKKKKN